MNELYIELEDFGLRKSFAHYISFGVGSEVEGYPISFLEGYDGTAGNIKYFLSVKDATCIIRYITFKRYNG